MFWNRDMWKRCDLGRRLMTQCSCPWGNDKLLRLNFKSTPMTRKTTKLLLRRPGAAPQCSYAGYCWISVHFLLKLTIFFRVRQIWQKKSPTTMGFEPTQGDPSGLAVRRLNHSATLSSYILTCIVFIHYHEFWFAQSLFRSQLPARLIIQKTRCQLKMSHEQITVE